MLLTKFTSKEVAYETPGYSTFVTVLAGIKLPTLGLAFVRDLANLLQWFQVIQC